MIGGCEEDGAEGSGMVEFWSVTGVVLLGMCYILCTSSSV
jgi:hypothetical protein